MAWTQADLDALEAALVGLAGGARVVRYNNREVTKYDLSDLLALRDAMLADVQVQATAKAPYPYRVAATSKGLW